MTVPSPPPAIAWGTVVQTFGVIVQSMVALLTVFLAWRTTAATLADRAAHREEARRQGWITLAAVSKAGERVAEALGQSGAASDFSRAETYGPLIDRLGKINPSSIDSAPGVSGFLELQTLVDRLLTENPVQAARATSDLKSAMGQIADGMKELGARSRASRLITKRGGQG